MVWLGSGRDLQGKGGQGWKLDCRFGTMNILQILTLIVMSWSLSVLVILRCTFEEVDSKLEAHVVCLESAIPYYLPH